MWNPKSNNEDYHNTLLTVDCGIYSLLWNQDSYMSVQTLTIWSARPQSQGYLTFRKENKHLPHDPCFLTFNSAERDIIHAGKLLTNRNNFFKPKSRSKLSLESFNSVVFFFFWWQIRTVGIYHHAQTQKTGQITPTFQQFYSADMIAIKLWFLLARKIHLLSLGKKKNVKQTENDHKLTL